MIADQDPGDEHDDRPREICPMCGQPVIMTPTEDRNIFFWHIGLNERIYPTHTAEHCGMKLMKLPLDEISRVSKGDGISLEMRCAPEDDPRLS